MWRAAGGRGYVRSRRGRRLFETNIPGGMQLSRRDRSSEQPTHMASSKRRKTPVTGTDTRTRPSSTKTRAVIRKFHLLLKSRRKLEGQPDNERELEAIDKQISGLGGLDAYQAMSKLGQSAERGGGTETVLIDWLKDIVKEDPLGDGQKLRCVGHRIIFRLR